MPDSSALPADTPICAKAPVVVVIFNRPDHAARLRDSLRGQESRDLYVLSDAARPQKVGEAGKVEECRRIFEDWPGSVKFNCATVNMGCKGRVFSGLDWVFEMTDRAIVLEDDLLAREDFFSFCDWMLELYAETPGVLSVCGSKIYPGAANGHFLSKYANCWGWATWRRAWKNYDDQFAVPSFTGKFLHLRSYLGTARASIYWLIRMWQVRSGRLSSWFFCWMLTSFFRDGLHVYPPSNLVLNQGYGADSTHTREREPYMPISYGPRMALPAKRLEPTATLAEADRWIEDNLYSKSPVVRWAWLVRKVKGLLRRGE